MSLWKFYEGSDLHNSDHINLFYCLADGPFSRGPVRYIKDTVNWYEFHNRPVITVDNASGNIDDAVEKVMKIIIAASDCSIPKSAPT